MKIQSTFALVLLSFLSLALSPPGGGVKEERDITGFTAIEVHNAIKVFVKQGDHKVVVETDAELMDQITTVVENGTLVIKNEKKRGKSEDVTLYISMPGIKAVDAYGASIVKFEDAFEMSDFRLGLSGASRFTAHIMCDGSMDVDASGASKLNLAGSAREVVVDLSGAAIMKGEKFDIENMQLQISGAARADVHVSGEFSVEASGAGNVSYSGNPKKLSKTASGGASIKERG